MRVLMLSWEYPPKGVGGLAQHVYDLSSALAKNGDEIHVISCGGPDLPAFEEVNGVQVHRVAPLNLRAPDFKTWILHLNISILEYAMGLLHSFGSTIPVDVVHNHDWLTAYAARAIKHAYSVPLIGTIHATEWGRNQGLHTDEQRYISDVEWWLTYESWRVIVCSNYMEEELKRIFQLPKDKLRVIPNGINPVNFAVKPGQASIKTNYASPDQKLVYFVGRLVHEKGVQVLLDAVPKILHYHPKTKFVIAGKGPNEEYLRGKATEMGIAHHIYFTGYIDDKTRNALYKEADVAVIPSLYEPFGIVALEGMAAQTPVVVSDTGGLSEIIKHEQNGLKIYPGSASSLADNVLKILCDPGFGDKLKANAYQEVEAIYSWDKIAQATKKVYEGVLSEWRASQFTVQQNQYQSVRIQYN